jgi:hypothetical protein
MNALAKDSVMPGRLSKAPAQGGFLERRQHRFSL